MVVLALFFDALEFKDAAAFDLILAKVILISIFFNLLWAYNFSYLRRYSGYFSLILLIFLEYIFEAL